MSKKLNIDDDWTSFDPQQNIIPSANSDVAEIISTEANYDRWSNFLFPHSRSPEIYGRRTKQWEAKLPDWRVAESRIEVIPAQDTKSYTTKTYDVFLALIALWKERNMPDEPMELFLSDISRKLDLKASGKALNNILEELRCLEETKISWVFSFQTKNSREETYKWQRVLSVFNYVKIKERSFGSSASWRCTVRFSDHIMKNIRNRLTIPVNFTARKSIKSEVAKALYNRVDSLLAKMDRHEKTAINLINELSLKASRYQYKSQRKAFVQLIQNNLDWLPLSCVDAHLRVTILETTNKQDWKCVFSKTNSNKPSAPARRLEIINKDPQHRDYLVQIIIDAIWNKKQNIRLYNLFALYYSENLIRRAIGEYKELVQIWTIENKQAYFTSIMHTLCHKLNKEWIKHCEINCKYRPENQLFPDN